VAEMLRHWLSGEGLKDSPGCLGSGGG